jgi:hypothetical protein
LTDRHLEDLPVRPISEHLPELLVLVVDLLHDHDGVLRERHRCLLLSLPVRT